MINRRSLAPLLFGLLFSLGALGCSSSPAELEPPSDPSILGFHASPTAINRGQTSTLRWDVSDATAISLEDGSGAPIELSEEALEARAVDVSPEETTTYVLSARGRSGRLLQRQAKVAVRAEKPRVLSFEASPREVRPGEDVILSWATSSTETVQIIAGESQAISLEDPSAREGSVTVRPLAATTYTLKAWSEIGVAEETVRVAIVGGLDVELIPDRSLIGFGESTTLRWRSRSADRVVLRQGEEVLVDTKEELSGSIEISPETLTLYEIEARSSVGVVTAEAEVRALPVIERFAPAAEGPFARGAEVELEWLARGAQSLQVRSSAGVRRNIEEEELLEGRVRLPIPQDGRFEIEAGLDEETVVRTLALPLLDPPQVDSFEVVSDRTTLEEGEQAQVSFRWETSRAISVELGPVGGEPFSLSEGDLAAGSFETSLTTGGTFLLVARNAAGEASARAELRLYAAPVIDSFEASPSHVGVGESFTLSWTARNAATIRIEQDGQPIHTTSAGNESGSFSTQIAASSTLRLIAANGAGATAGRSLSITAGPPALTSFTVEKERYGPSSTGLFSWEAIGGVQLTLKGPDGATIAACSTADLQRIAQGECIVDLPATLGIHGYTLTLENGIGQRDHRSLEIEVVDGPSIFSFFAERSPITLGDSVRFSWETGLGAGDEPPSLSLTDGSDTYPLGDADPLEGSADIIPLRSGSRNFRLTASTSRGEASTRDFVLQVLEPPTLTVSASSTIYLPDEGPITLRWQTSHATELMVEELVDGEAPNRIGLFVDPALVAAGSVDVVPPAPSRRYRLTASNAAGATIVEELEVSWELPQIVEFYAAPDRVAIKGGAPQLHWHTTSTDSVTIEPMPLIESDAFVDISGNETATELGLVDCGEATMPQDGCASIQLPFPFPYAGQENEQARVYLNGVISFDAEYEGASLPPRQLPSTAAPFAHLAPFWQPLSLSAEGSSRVGRIFADEIEVRGDTAFIIQWTGFWAAGSSAAAPVELSFQVVLFQNGAFDFRYGGIHGAAALTNGASASIGYQSGQGRQGRSITFERALDRPLAATSIGIRSGVLPTSGSLPLLPLFLETDHYTLTATNVIGSRTATASLTAEPPVSLSGVRVVDEFPEKGLPFTVEWTVVGASQVVVELPRATADEPPVILCDVGPESPQRCSLQENAAGTYSYVVRAFGHGSGDEMSTLLDVEVLQPFGIRKFVGPSLIPYEGSVTIEWEVENPETFALTANGASVSVPPAWWAAASRTFSALTIDTEFKLVVTSKGRQDTRTLLVLVEEPPPPPPDDDEENDE